MYKLILVAVLSASLMFTGESFNDGKLHNFVKYDASNGKSTYGHTDPHATHLYSAKAVTVKDGHLVITATKQANGTWRSGFVGSREKRKYLPLYGTISVRAYLPRASGIWPAIWLRHRNGSSTAEVDIAEVFAAGKHSVTQSLHLPKTDGYHRIGKGSITSPGRHTYRVKIEPVGKQIRFTFYIDNTKTASYTTKDASLIKKADPNATWDLAMNIATTNNKWSGNSNKAKSPQIMRVNWVAYRPLR